MGSKVESSRDSSRNPAISRAIVCQDVWLNSFPALRY